MKTLSSNNVSFTSPFVRDLSWAYSWTSLLDQQEVDVIGVKIVWIRPEYRMDGETVLRVSHSTLEFEE